MLTAVPAWVRRRRLAVLAVVTILLVAVVAIALASGHDPTTVHTQTTGDTVSVTTTPVVTTPPTTTPAVQIQVSVPAIRPGGKKHGRGKG